ncbi:PREDICTED: putative nuclease HARBI1 [Rhagoletis zephyria]|uniref:putative nuclease HARBI1 n=1 Tax=Rhagoletis zephyria TaxID=28612 RepID=UPI0008119CDC|nr:PREDICTED: putative nuclease HARBI1 [Rhagoletis zephyria]XP_017492243.1 PREDICTED: putative nuclease HARBI1 [Rhagoletis zephyria]
MFLAKVRFPMTQIERQAAKEIFASASAPFVGGTVGAIDRTHVSIMSPKNHEEAYVNHHGYHSINVQMICDPNIRFWLSMLNTQEHDMIQLFGAPL